MKKHIQIEQIPFRSEEWYKYRQTGIGASDVAIVMGLMPYRPTKMELYHFKIGTEPLPREENEALFWGSENEDKVADMWQYWDGEDYGYISNKSNNNLIRRCRRLNGIIRNPKYPWLFGDVDRLANIGAHRMDTGEVMKNEFPVECKTISHYAANMWEQGIPYYHICQITTYMMILDVDYAEIATLKDGRHFEVLPIELSDVIANRIKEETHQFWHERILPGQELVKELRVAEANGKRSEINRIQGEIQRLEPAPDENPKYMEYLSERFKKDDELMNGDLRQYILAHNLKDLNRYKKELVAVETELKNHLRSEFVRNKVEKIGWEDEGYARYFLKTNQKNHTLDNRIKPGVETPFDILSLQHFKSKLSKWKNDYV